jgi:NADPH-dependent curcumin reductase CurA
VTNVTRTNRQWLLRRRPVGTIVADDFEYREDPLPIPQLRESEILMKTRLVLCAPTMRNWMDPPGNGFYRSMPIGTPVIAPVVGEVVASRHSRYPVGSRITTLGSWQDFQTINAEVLSPRVIPDDITSLDALGVFGLNALTAYFGVLRVGGAKAADTLVVSGAAGSTGSIAAQIGKIAGCRVIGIAGGPAKCDWLVKECKLDAAVDYKAKDFADILASQCPLGINLFYDNVGGEVLQTAVNLMARRGCIVLCGQIATYNESRPAEGPRNMMRLVYGGISMRGFLITEFEHELTAALADLRRWKEEGKLIHREDVRNGFRNIPETFGAIFKGENMGTLIAAIDD